MRHLKGWAIVAALAAILTGLTGVGPASAGVEPGMLPCSTSDLVGSYTVGGAGLAELDLYWDPTHGTNCAKMVHLGAAYGHAADTEIQIYTCQGDTPGKYCAFESSTDPRYYGYDEGTYSYYAGPASVVGAGHCIWAIGKISWDGQQYWIETDPNFNGTHCP